MKILLFSLIMYKQHHYLKYLFKDITEKNVANLSDEIRIPCQIENLEHQGDKMCDNEECSLEGVLLRVDARPRVALGNERCGDLPAVSLQDQVFDAEAHIVAAQTQLEAQLLAIAEQLAAEELI